MKVNVRLVYPLGMTIMDEQVNAETLHLERQVARAKVTPTPDEHLNLWEDVVKIIHNPARFRL